MAILLAAPAWAGTLLIETQVAAEVQTGGLTLAHTYGPGRVSVPDIAAGTKVFDVYRSGNHQAIEIEVPETGRVRLLVGTETLLTDTPPESPADAAPPVLELRAVQGEKFSLILNGERKGVFSSHEPIRVADLGPGEHTLELRTTDNLTVWVRGSLSLRPGDEVVVQAAEGRMVEVYGRTGVWKPKGG